MPDLAVGPEIIPWTLRFSPRAKRLRIIVRPGAVEVVAPVGWPMHGPRGVLTFVEARREWVREAVGKVGALAPAKAAPLRCDDGATVAVRGAPHVLAVRAARVRRASVVGAEARERWDVVDRADPADPHTAMDRGEDGPGAGRVAVVVPIRMDAEAQEAAVRAALTAWLRAQALDDARGWVAEYGDRLGRRAADVRLTNAERRWGSCSAAGVVRVHWRLVQAPPQAFEYVVAHEIAHLSVRDHSARFWATVAGLMPDYVERRAALKAWERALAQVARLP